MHDFWYKVSVQDPLGPEASGLRQNLTAVELAEPILHLTCCTQVLAVELGYSASAQRGLSVWGDGQPIPMWTYSCIEYLAGLDLQSFDVLELGGGQSSKFFAPRVKSLTVIESDSGWVEQLARELAHRATVIGAAPGRIAAAMTNLSGPFGLIAIDPAENRYACALEARRLLKPGGVVVLDNSDWYPNTAALLRSQDLIQVDFPDFRPLHHYRTVTSLFLDPGFRPSPRANRLPAVPIGGKRQDANVWDAIG